MSHWEAIGLSSEWRTPRYIFESMGVEFDLDVAAPKSGVCHVPAKRSITGQSLALLWDGFVWMNPPFGGRNGLEPWLDRFFRHGNGVALVPDRTSAPWFQKAANEADWMLFISPKVRFLRPDGTEGASPSTGTVLMAVGYDGGRALFNANAQKLGVLAVPVRGGSGHGGAIGA